MRLQESKPEAAARVKQRVRELTRDCELMLEGLAAGNYFHVVHFPEFARRFQSYIAELNAGGYTPEVLGPYVEELFAVPGETWQDIAPAYEAFKLAIADLGDCIAQNIGAFGIALDDVGRVVFTADSGSAPLQAIAVLAAAALAASPEQ